MCFFFFFAIGFGGANTHNIYSSLVDLKAFVAQIKTVVYCPPEEKINTYIKNLTNHKTFDNIKISRNFCKGPAGNNQSIYISFCLSTSTDVASRHC